MKIRSIGAIALLAGSALCAAPGAWAQDVTMKQVYQAAEAGKFIEAQAMMDKVLREHPNSAKAHYVEAELLAKQGKFARAATELASAERLAPGLPFAKPEGLQKLRALVAGATPARAREALPAAAAPDLSYERQVPVSVPASERGGIPWSMLLLVAALAAAAFFYFRGKAARSMGAQRYSPPAGPGGAGMGGGYPQYANAGGAPVGPGMAAPGGGIGSGIMGGLATGAALGAGLVAGEALMHHFTDGNRNERDASAGNHLASGNDALSTPDPLFNNDTPPSGYDMGGDDFGVSDPGSWDSGDSGGGGDDDWT